MIDLKCIESIAYRPTPVEQRIIDIDRELANLPPLPPHTGFGPRKIELTTELTALEAQLPHDNYTMPKELNVQS